MTLQYNVLYARSGTILCGASAGVLRNLRFEQFNIVAEGGGTKGPVPRLPAPSGPAAATTPNLGCRTVRGGARQREPCYLGRVVVGWRFQRGYGATYRHGGGALGKRKRAGGHDAQSGHA